MPQSGQRTGGGHSTGAEAAAERDSADMAHGSVPSWHTRRAT
jgi:hypothetical protein